MASILQGKYPAKAHAKRVVEYITKKHGKAEGMLYLEGQKSRMNEDNDQEAPFRQRRYFYYLTGCELPDSYATYDIAKGHLTLFIPPIDPEEVVWSGLPLSPEQALEKYDVDDVKPSTEVNSILTANDGSSKKAVWAIDHQVSNHITFLEFDQKDMTLLKEAIEECRVVKDAYEIALMRHANDISAKAHDAVLRSVKTATNERELEGLFLSHCIAGGCRHQAYSSIVATGTSAATLHYIHNDAPITSSKLNLLLDAGGEYKMYASDITRTFPVNGKFTKESAAIYSIVLRMQKECMDMVKTGVLWDDVHAHAHRVAIQGLLDLGILKGGDVETIHASKTSAVFFPHGLGHYLGMDTHDSGGHPNYSDPDPLFRYLRVRGTLPAGSIVTVEPGVYFCRFMIEPALKDPARAKFIDAEVLERYWEVGGVRIEDNIVVTDTGYDNLTTVPKEIEDMERIINHA